MRLRLCLILLLFLAWNASAWQIVEFCPDPYLSGDPDEYMVIEGYGCTDGLVVTDGEGGFRFPPGTVLEGRTTIARNGAAFYTIHGYYPDFEWEYCHVSVPDVQRSGRLQLANSQDEIQLFVYTTLLQEIAWPGDVHPRQGQVHYMEGDEWDRRILLLGQSRFSEAEFTGIPGTAFVSPDCSYPVFEEAVNCAQDSILLNVYEFTSMKMAELLVSAKKRGVNVTVLLEGGPVGGIPAEERTVIRRLSENGIRVLQMSITDDFHAPYRFNHAKYMVIDGCRVLITSENFKENGFPDPGISGNRGWGVCLEDEGLASYFADIFEYDCSGAWIEEASGAGGVVDDPYFRQYEVEFEPVEFTSAHVIPVISPDTSHLVREMLEGANESIAIEEAYIANISRDQLNPFLGAAIDASRRGVTVRVLLDSYWYNVEGECDNDEMVGFINSLAAREGIPLEARCADLDQNNLEKIHNKGVIVDGRSVLVSSINWNFNSPNFNREVGVIITEPHTAAYFLSAFDDDWNAASCQDSDNSFDYLKLAVTGVVIFALVLLYLHRRR